MISADLTPSSLSCVLGTALDPGETGTNEWLGLVPASAGAGVRGGLHASGT